MKEAFARKHGIIDSFELVLSDSGLLSGKTFVAKDLIDVKGMITGGGNPFFSLGKEPAFTNASCLDKILSAGATLLGKSQTDELALSLDGLNNFFETPFNALYPQRIPGGSSSGSASATAAAIVDFGLGSDTAGSIRVPAAYCGLFGIRPSHGLVPLDGVLPLGPSFDTVGWLAREPEILFDVATVLVDGRASLSSRQFRKVLFPVSLFNLVHHDLSSDLLSLAKSYACQFKEMEEIEFDTRLLEIWSQLFSIVRSYEAWQIYGPWIEENGEHLSADILTRFLDGKSVDQNSLTYAKGAQVLAREMMSKLLGEDTLFILPTVWNLPPFLDSSQRDLAYNRSQNIKLTVISTLCGLPQVAFPVELNNGQRLSLSLIGPANSDLDMLHLLKAHLT